MENEIRLTKREQEVFELLVQDISPKQIAKDLFVSESGVRAHMSRGYKKLGVKNLTQAYIKLRELQLV